MPTYVPSAQAVVATGLLSTNLSECPPPGPFSMGVTPLNFQCVADAIFGALSIPSFAWIVAAKSVSFNADPWTHYAVDTASGDVTATLPDPTTLPGQELSFKKLAAAHSMILASASLIDGNASISMDAQYTAVTLRSSGTTWDVV